MNRREGDGVRARARSALSRRLGIDTRALAALRIALGLLLLADLFLRSRDLVALYTSEGVLPRSVLTEAFPTFSKLTFHTATGGAWVQVLLFSLAGLVALALLAGYRTRLATLVSLVLLVSLQARNPMVLNAGDSVLRRLLFWSLLLPLGERWSVDALHGDGPRRRVSGVASAALLLQVVLIYAVNGLLKLRGDLWIQGRAIEYVFGLDQLTILLGDALAEYPLLLAAFDYLWMAMVLGSVLLVLLTGRARAAFAALFMAMHFGMFLTMRLGPFPLISIAALLPFLPPEIWDRVERRVSAPLGGRVETARLRRRIDRVRPNVPVELPPRVSRGARRLAPALASLFLAFVLVWNAASLGVVAVPDAVGSAVDPGERRWDMFAPEPRGDDGWYVVPGRTESGRTVDAFHGGRADWRRPPDLADAFPSHRWLVYLLNVRDADDEVRDRFGAYLCERWNADHGDDLRNLTVYSIEEPTRLDGPETTRRTVVTRRSCSGGT